MLSESLNQSRVLSFQEADKIGKSYQYLDTLYRSAIHADPLLAVFKETHEQQQLQKAYHKLLLDLALFLKENGFQWGKSIRCFNRIYFSPAGRIDYFLYHFLPDRSSPGESITDHTRLSFESLLTRFVDGYQLIVTAKEPFFQCSPVTYND